MKLVPARAVEYVFGSNKAYVVTPANTIEAREVKLGDRFDQNVEILEGVEDGEKVAVMPNSTRLGYRHQGQRSARKPI